MSDGSQRRASGTVAVRVAAKLASWEMGLSEKELRAEEIKRMYSSLYHARVPKLVDEGILLFDETSEVIRPGPNTQQVLTALAGAGASLDARREAHARREHDDSDE